nr:MAG: polyprotein 1 [Picornavirales sp.]
MYKFKSFQKKQELRSYLSPVVLKKQLDIPEPKKTYCANIHHNAVDEEWMMRVSQMVKSACLKRTDKCVLYRDDHVGFCTVTIVEYHKCHDLDSIRDRYAHLWDKRERVAEEPSSVDDENVQAQSRSFFENHVMSSLTSVIKGIVNGLDGVLEANSAFAIGVYVLLFGLTLRVVSDLSDKIFKSMSPYTIILRIKLVSEILKPYFRRYLSKDKYPGDRWVYLTDGSKVRKSTFDRFQKTFAELDQLRTNIRLFTDDAQDMSKAYEEALTEAYKRIRKLEEVISHQHQSPFDNIEQDESLSEDIANIFSEVSLEEDIDGPSFKPDVVEAQSGLPFKSLTAAIVFILGKRVGLYRRVADHEKLMRGVQSMLEGSAIGFEVICNLFLKAFGKDPVRLIKASEREIEDWLSNVRTFSAKILTEKLSPCESSVRSSYDALVLTGIKYASEHKSGFNAVAVARGNCALAELATLFPSASGATRMEPLVIVIRGPPGCGKSTFSRILAKYIARNLCTKEEIEQWKGPEKMLFCKGTSEYWEGYGGQPICAFDDFGQAKLVAGSPDNEVMTFIRACNQWPFPLNMASLAHKGKTYFTSRFIIMTTNDENAFNLGGLVHCPAAVLRRYDIALEMSLEGSLCVKSPSWSFKNYDFLSGQVVGGSFSVSDILSMVRQRYERRINMERHINDIVDEVVAAQELKDKVEREELVEPQSKLIRALACVGIATIAHSVAKVIKPGELVGDFVGSAKKVSTRLKSSKRQCTSVTRTEQLAQSFAHEDAAARQQMEKSRRKEVSKPRMRCAKALACIGTLAVAHSVKKVFDLGNSIGKTVGAIRNVTKRVGKFAPLCIQVSIVCVLVKALFSMLPFAKKKKTDEIILAQHDQVAFALSNHVIPIYTCVNGLEHSVGNLILIDCKTIAYNYHYIDQVRTLGAQLYYKWMGETYSLNVGNIIGPFKEQDSVRDLVIETLPHTLQKVRDIRPHLRSRTRIEKGHVIMLKGQQGTLHFSEGGNVNKHYSNVMGGVNVFLVKYDAMTENGDCGALIIRSNPSNQKRILGIHSGASDVSAFYTPIYLEDVGQYAVAQSSIIIKDKVAPVYNSGDPGLMQTSYSGTICQTGNAVAALRPKEVDGVIIDPMIKAISDTDITFSDALPECLNDVAKFTVNRIFSFIDQSQLRLLNDEEIIKGNEHKYVQPINRGTSPGYPYCLTMHDKRKAFGETEYTLETDKATEIYSDMHRLEEMYRENSSDVIYRDALKPETLPLRKVKVCQTRLLSCAPVHYTMLWRKYFGMFTGEFMRTRLNHGGMIGINPYSTEWSHFASHITRFGTPIYDGDFKQFDKRQHPAVLKALLDQLCLRLSHLGDIAVLEGLCRDVYQSTHLGGDSFTCGQLYEKSGSLPSGHPATSILNSMYNMFLFHSFIYTKFGVNDLLDVDNIFSLGVYGDDNIWSFDAKHQIDIGEIVDHFSLYGMTYTSATKDGVPEGKSLVESQFIKRGFKWDGSWLNAPLEKDSIGDMLNWRKRKISDEDHFDVVHDVVLRESSLHGYEYYAENYNKLTQMVDKLCLRKCMLLSMPVVDSYTMAKYAIRTHVPSWSTSIIEIV